MVVEAYAELAGRILAGPARLGRTRLVAVDGPSGAGKTVFAGRLAAALGAALAASVPAGPPVVHTDDLLDGWADQFGFWQRLQEEVLAPLRAGEPGGYRRYDWIRGEFGAAPVPVPPAPVVILEGVSAARTVIRPELTCSIFVTAPSRLRLDRALARDGAALRPQLLRWRRGERTHFTADGTEAAADLVVDAASARVPDPATHYVGRRRA